MNYEDLYHKEYQVRKRASEDYFFCASNFFRITCKDPNQIPKNIDPKYQGTIPLISNTAQRYIHNLIEEQKKRLGYIRAIILKGRQQGCSTYVASRYLWILMHNFGMNCYIIAHLDDAATGLLEITKRMHKLLPDELKPLMRKCNEHEFVFDKLDSSYGVGSASGKDVGRSSTIHLLHGSEIGSWKYADEIISSVMPTIPPTKSEVILEGTAKGEGNFFHQQWIKASKGESDYIPIFVPWFWQPEYTDDRLDSLELSEEDIEIRDLYKLSNEQMRWRQRMIAAGGERGLELFKQEYPLNPEEAFKATQKKGLIPDFIVKRARTTQVNREGPIIIGVDPARSEHEDGDRTSIICRQTRCAFGLQSFRTNNTMKIVGILLGMIKDLNPSAICIDVIGIGSGIVDRLRELGYSDIVYPIVAGAAPYNDKKYKRKKDENWGLMADWLYDYPCQIPDVDSLQTDLCAPLHDYNSNAQMFIEGKKSLKDRFGQSYSPDEGDALSNTFAVPLRTIIPTTFKSQKIFTQLGSITR